MAVKVLAGTVKAAQEAGADVVLCDTSGRLHTNWRLMDELQLVVRDIDGVQKGAPHETLLVLDGSTGLNMMNQVRGARTGAVLCCCTPALTRAARSRTHQSICLLVLPACICLRLLDGQ
jgi:hypothetical protein